jgi:hypothetical protein
MPLRRSDAGAAIDETVLTIRIGFPEGITVPRAHVLATTYANSPGGGRCGSRDPRWPLAAPADGVV